MSVPVLLSLGSINADFQVRTPRPLQAGETLLGTDFVRLGGGKAANVAYLAHRLNCPTRLLGRVGQDDLREQALAPLRRAGLCLDHVGEAPDQPTAVSMIAVATDGKSIVLAANANDAWDAAASDAVIGAISEASSGSVLVADYEIAPAVVARAIEAAHARGLRIVLDPAPADRADHQALARSFALTPDAREAGELTNTDARSVGGAARAVTALAGLGVPLVCIKLADGGCLFSHEHRLTHIPPVAIDVVDTTGAADAFTGALAVALLEGQTPLGAALFATAASHLAVTGYGSQESYPSRAQIEAFVPRLARTAHAFAA